MDARTAGYTAYLRTHFGPQFFCEGDQDSRAPGERAFWVKYRLGERPLKIAVISDFPQFSNGPGSWLYEIAAGMNWPRMIESAKASFSRDYDARHALGIDQAVNVPLSS